MTGKMDWRRARLHGRRTLDFRREHDIPDRAERWLTAVDPQSRLGTGRRQQERRRNTGPSRRTNWVTANSTEVPARR